MINRVIGYVLDQPGYRYKDKYYFEGTARKIAIFTLMNQNFPVIITTICDEMICTSLSGGFLDICKDKKFLKEELLPAITPLQMGKSYDPLVFEEIEHGIMQEVRKTNEKEN